MTKKLHPLQEKYGVDYFKTLGSKGGLKKNKAKGFGSSRQRASEAGKKGKPGKRAKR